MTLTKKQIDKLKSNYRNLLKDLKSYEQFDARIDYYKEGKIQGMLKAYQEVFEILLIKPNE